MNETRASNVVNTPVHGITGGTPVIPGLVYDLTNVVYSKTCGLTKYMLSMISKDWNLYCISKMKIIENHYKSIEQHCKKCNILEIVRNYRNLRAYIITIYACKYNIRLLISIMTRLGNKNYDFGLHGACMGGHMDIVEYMIKCGARDYEYGLFGACLGGHMDIVNYMIKCGAYDYNIGLYGACIGGHINVAKFMIECGANNYNYGLFGACGGEKIDIMKYMIDIGATSCRCGKSINEHLNRINK
jgi:hypothetical protein